MLTRLGGAARLLLLGAGAAAVSCLRPEPIVERHVHELVPGALEKVAIVPLYPQLQSAPAAPSPEPEPQPRPDLQPRPQAQPVPRPDPSPGSPESGAAGGGAAADLVSRFLAEAFEAGGIETVAPSDLVLAFEGKGLVIPRLDVEANAKLATEQFGATSVLLGRLVRYREREGQAIGVQRPASVWFEVDLYTAPAGVHVFSARFDQTQQSLSSNVFLARKYPGSGTRWLAAAELARWGAEHVVEALPEGAR